MFLRQIEAYLQHKLTEDQENLTKLLSNFLFHSPDTKIFIINGYAGTGKTTNLAIESWMTFGMSKKL